MPTVAPVADAAHRAPSAWLWPTAWLKELREETSLVTRGAPCDRLRFRTVPPYDYEYYTHACTYQDTLNLGTAALDCPVPVCQCSSARGREANALTHATANEVARISHTGPARLEGSGSQGTWAPQEA